MGLRGFLGAALASLVKETEFGFCDGIRALAVLWVCADHAAIEFHLSMPVIGDRLRDLWWPVAIPSSGAAGVDAFLVLSGFLIGGSLFREVSGSGRISLGKFVIRRLFRIYPALFSALLLTIASHAALGLTPVCPASPWWHNTFLFKDLWADGCMLHTWSVSLELQLYMATPAVFMLASWVSSCSGGRYSLSRCVALLCALMWTACVAYRLFFMFSLTSWQQVELTSLYFYFRPEFRCAPYIAGVLAGVLVAERRQRDAGAIVGGPIATLLLAIALIVVASTCIVGCDVNSHENTLGVAWYRREFPTLAKLHMSFARPVLGAAVSCIIVLCADGQVPRTAKILGSSAWRPLAGLSYSMYLLQFVGKDLFQHPFIAAVSDGLDSKDAPLKLAILADYTGIALFILGAVILALFNYILVERPGMKAGSWIVSKLARRGLLGDSSAKTSAADPRPSRKQEIRYSQWQKLYNLEDGESICPVEVSEAV